jgi:hypothetical protein
MFAMLHLPRLTRRGFGAAVLCICTVFLLSGCGNKNPTTIRVQGKITYRGKPLEKAEVQFSPVSASADSKALQRIAAGEVDSQGVYSLSTFTKGDGALPGEYAVTVTRIKRKTSIDGVEPTGGKAEPFAPEQYARQDTTPLKASIPADASGTLNLDFELKD